MMITRLLQCQLNNFERYLCISPILQQNTARRILQFLVMLNVRSVPPIPKIFCEAWLNGPVLFAAGLSSWASVHLTELANVHGC